GGRRGAPSRPEPNASPRAARGRRIAPGGSPPRPRLRRRGPGARASLRAMRGEAARMLANGRAGARPEPRRAVALAAAALAAACSGAPAPSRPADGSLTVALEAAPIHLDPRVATDQASS